MSHKTAITRSSLSAPARWLKDNGKIRGRRKLDMGCGKGFDADELGMVKYDPYWFPKTVTGKFDLILCTYVLNVLPESLQKEAVRVMKYSLRDEKSKAYISVRRDLPKEGKPGRGCYQRYVELDLPSVHKNSSFEIYELNK